MSCEEIRNLALLSMSGEASAVESAAVAEHESRCPACAEEIRALREGLELLRHAPAETPSKETRARLEIMARNEARRPAQRRAWAYAAAAAVLLAGLAVALVRISTGGAAKTPVAAEPKSPEAVAPKPIVADEPKAPAPKPADDRIAWTPVADEDLESLSEALAEFRGTASVASTPRSSIDLWLPSGTSSNLDALYESLDMLSTGASDF